MAAWQSRQVEALSLGYAGLTGVKNADARVAGLVTTDKRKAQGRLRLSGSQGGIILEDGSQGPWTRPANGWVHLLFALKGAPDFFAFLSTSGRQQVVLPDPSSRLSPGLWFIN